MRNYLLASLYTVLVLLGFALLIWSVIATHGRALPWIIIIMGGSILILIIFSMFLTLLER
jgi:hypothetical protein